MHERYDVLVEQYEGLSRSAVEARCDLHARCCLAALVERRAKEAFFSALALMNDENKRGDPIAIEQAMRLMVATQAGRGGWGHVVNTANQWMQHPRFPPRQIPPRDRPPEDAWEEAIDELQQVALWASVRSPAWVRAIGVVCERTAEENLRSSLLPWFWQWLDALRAGPDGDEDGVRVVDELRQRGHGGLADQVETTLQNGA
jgi:hypothetical protein